MNSQPVWISLDGLCVFGYVPDINIERLSVETEGKHDFGSPSNYRFAVVANNVFWLFGEDGATCIDFRRDLIIYNRTIFADYGWYDESLDKLYIVLNGTINEIDAGEIKPAQYMSPEIALGKTGTIKRINFDADGEVSFQVFVDGVGRFKATSRGRGHRQVRVSAGLTGSRFSIQTSVDSELRSIQAEITTSRY